MKKIHVLTLACTALAIADVQAAVSMPHIFGDNMVLQRGQKIPVWGKASPGERVTVVFAGRKASAVADEKGSWSVSLAALKANSKGLDFHVTGKNEIVFKNVVVGEVWFCSGQSNMEFPVGPGGVPWDKKRCIKNSESEVAAAKHPNLRHFKVGRKTAAAPLDDVDAKWEPTTPESVVRQSAVAYIFGETLMKELHVPVGLINSSWGGTRIEPWTPAGHPDDLWLLQHLNTYKSECDTPTMLWNGMVAGLVPYAIKGAIWYQGEANRKDGNVYLDKTVSLVRGWRREWGQGDFPYFLVQIAPYKYDDAKSTVVPIFQEVQARVPEVVPNSGYTVINDVGNVDDVHPTDKRTVGMRLADQVLDRVYGKAVRPWRTPVPKSSRVEGAEFRVTMENADGLKTRDGKAPTCFEICGADGAWKPADARIDGHDVVLKARGVEMPVSMRFAAYNGSTPNLVNGAGLPAGPFRIGSKAAKLGDAEKLPELQGMRCVQKLNLPANINFAANPPEVLASVEGVKRVAYLLELADKDGGVEFVMTAMDAFSARSDDLVLTGKNGARRVRRPISHLTVRSNSPTVRTVTDADCGFLEFYTCNYLPKAMPEPAGGDNMSYDFNDTMNEDGDRLGYGCLQVHDIVSKTTVFAINRLNNSTTQSDIGIGHCRGGGRGHPDWTFAANGGQYSVRRFSVWVE